jgi:hypothetical protein
VIDSIHKSYVKKSGIKNLTGLKKSIKCGIDDGINYSEYSREIHLGISRTNTSAMISLSCALSWQELRICEDIHTCPPHTHTGMTRVRRLVKAGPTNRV